MTYTPTLEEFLAQTEADEAELPDPLESIADSLRRLVVRVEQDEEAEKTEDHLQQLLDQLDREYADLQSKLEQVLEVCKPSTSKLANRIREILQPGETSTDDSAVEPAAGAALPDAPPADDAPVEEWRAYARSRGLHAHPDIETANRSQIRTMLGLPHPASDEAGVR